MGTVGDALDKDVAESFFATLECELLDRYDWPTRQALRSAVFYFIEVFYNRQRRHSTLDYRTPSTTSSSTDHSTRRIANVSTKAANSMSGTEVMTLRSQVSYEVLSAMRQLNQLQA